MAAKQTTAEKLADLRKRLEEAQDPGSERSRTRRDEAGRTTPRQRINELPAVQARLVRMSYFEAKSHSEIAQALGMPLGTVKSHLRRAFLQLQAKVGGAL